MNDLSNNSVPQISFLEVLRNNNPFSSNAAADPWNNSFPDVISINKQAFEEICTLIERKAASPRIPLAGLVFGEAGSGKTHLMRRILLACQKSKFPSQFVFIKPLVDPKRPFRLLLQEIVHCLSKKSEGETSFSQFDRLIAEIIRDYVRHRVTKDPKCDTPNNRSFLEQFEANVFHVYDAEKVRAGVMEEIISDRVSPVSMEIIEKNAIRHVYLQEPETTSRQFLDVIFQYKTPEKRGIVLDWLKDKVLNEEDCEILGIPPRMEISDEAKEQEVREMILTLGVLFARYGLSLVLCFDQLDNLVKPELITGFASMIHLLVNDAASMLPLAFILADSWNERFNNDSPDSAFCDRAFCDRMESNKFVLSRGCTKEDAKELVSKRIEQMFGDGRPETIEMVNWLLPQLDLKMDRNRSPREVIRFANEIVRKGDSIAKLQPIPVIMAAEYKAVCEAVAADFDAWDPDSEYLKLASELFLNNQENILSCEPGDNKYMTWTGMLKTPEAEVPYACFINTSKHSLAVLASLDRCLIFLKEHPDALCTYITDARCDFRPTWKVTNEKRKEFESLGGTVLILDQPAAVRWYGLVSLCWKIGSGDISIEGEWQRAKNKDLVDFLKMEFSVHETEGKFDRLIKKKEVTSPKPTKQTQQPMDEELIEAMRASFSECVFPILKMQTILVKLHEKGINVTQEHCLEVIGKNQNVINLIPANDGFMVKLVV